MSNRRQFIGGSAALAASLAIPARATANVDRSEWDAAMQTFRRIMAEDAAFTPGWFETWKQCKAECEAVPHVTFEPEAYTGGRRQTTANAVEVAQARHEVAALDAGKMHLDDIPALREHYRIKRELVGAADRRETTMKSIRDRYGMDAMDERAEQLGEQLVAARDVLMAMPAPDLAALRWKLDNLREDDGDMATWTSDYVEQTFSDIARLLPEER